MHFMWAIVIGIVAGTLTNRLRPGHDRKHALLDAGVGLGAAVIMAAIGRLVGFQGPHGAPGPGFYVQVAVMWTLIAVTGVVVHRRIA
jgi:uncharacterized membrane protein YeaQ/YmgE (transglycosylase-associated protein family)